MYADITTLLKRIDERLLIQLTDDENTAPVTLATASSVLTDRITAAISDAEQMVDAYLKQQYTLPLDTFPPVLGQVTADIVIHGFYTRRSLPLPDVRLLNYKNSIKLLEDVATGRLELGLGRDKPEQARPEGSEFSAPAQQFTMPGLGVL